MSTYEYMIHSKMSVDVFGRNLGKTEGNRGPPGVGFKVTTNGH